MEKKLTEYTVHDFAGIFANDINAYLEKGGSIDDLSATNVFNVINDENAEDRFAFTKNVVMSALNFRSNLQSHDTHFSSGRKLRSKQGVDTFAKESNRGRKGLLQMGRHGVHPLFRFDFQYQHHEL